MSFLIEFIASIAEEMRWRQKTAVEQRVAQSVTAVLALTFIAGVIASVVLRVLSRRLPESSPST